MLVMFITLSVYQTSLSCHTWQPIIKALESKVRRTLCAFNFNPVLSEYVYFLGPAVQAERKGVFTIYGGEGHALSPYGFGRKFSLGMSDRTAG